MAIVPPPQAMYADLHREIKQLLTQLVQSLSDTKVNTLDLFHPFLANLMKLETYDVNRWHSSLTQELWQGFEIIANSEYCTQLLEQVDNMLRDSDKSEPLHFIRSELLFSSRVLPKKELKPYIQELVEKYPSNLEFQHTYAHCLINMNDVPSSEDNLTAINIYRKYIQAFKPYVPLVVLGYTYNLEVRFYQKLRDKKEYIYAQEWLDSMAQFKPYADDALFRNNTATLTEMLKERMHLEGTMKEQLKKYQDELDKSRSAQSNQLIQQLSIFTAIITFIITAAMANLSISGGFGTLAVFGIILIMFVITASIISDPPKALTTDVRGKILLGFGLICILLLGAVYLDQKEKFEFNCLYNCSATAYFPMPNSDDYPQPIIK